MWRLDIKNADGIKTKKLTVASGVSSDPYTSSWPNENLNKPIIHSAQVGTSLLTLQSPATDRVVVLGAAKSAYDTVLFLLKASKKVDWIIREDGSGPLAIMPPRILGIFNTVDVMATRALASFSAATSSYLQLRRFWLHYGKFNGKLTVQVVALLNTSGIWYKRLHKTIIGRAFTIKFWRNLTRAAKHHANYNKTENFKKLRRILSGYG